VVSGADADTFVFVDRGMEEGPGREGSGLELVRSTISDPHLSSRAMIVPFGEAHGCACCWGLIAGFRDSRAILLRESGFTGLVGSTRKRLQARTVRPLEYSINPLVALRAAKQRRCQGCYTDCSWASRIWQDGAFRIIIQQLI